LKTIKRLSLIAALLVAVTASAALADGREALRLRLDSIDVETQVRKRSGKPIDDLEAAGAALRDSLMGMRSTSPSAASDDDGTPGNFFSSLGPTLTSLWESAVSFKPSGLFDWVIVGTGAVAVLSVLLLLIGIIAGRRKKKTTDKKAPAAVKKINLARTETMPAFPDIPTTGSTYDFKGRLPDNPPPPPTQPQVPAELESLMDTLRKVSPIQQQQQATPPQPPAEPAFSSPPPPPPPPQPYTPPTPLIVTAPDSSPSQRKRNANIPKAGSPGFNESVIADAKNGLSDIEISRRYHISVDQVRLMLRMKQD